MRPELTVKQSWRTFWMQQKDFNSSCRGLKDLLETSKSLVVLWPNTGQCIPRLSLLQSVPFIHYSHTFVHQRRETMCPNYQSVIRLWYLSTFKSCQIVALSGRTEEHKEKGFDFWLCEWKTEGTETEAAMNHWCHHLIWCSCNLLYMFNRPPYPLLLGEWRTGNPKPFFFRCLTIKLCFYFV